MKLHRKWMLLRTVTFKGKATQSTTSFCMAVLELAQSPSWKLHRLGDCGWRSQPNYRGLIADGGNRIQIGPRLLPLRSGRHRLQRPRSEVEEEVGLSFFFFLRPLLPALLSLPIQRPQASSLPLDADSSASFHGNRWTHRAARRAAQTQVPLHSCKFRTVPKSIYALCDCCMWIDFDLGSVADLIGGFFDFW